MSSYDDSTLQNWAGLLVGIPSTLTNLGTNSGSSSKPNTPAVATEIVGETQVGGGFWDSIGGALSAVGANQLVNRYLNGKITKTALNDGVPIYTTYGNPNDQAGGKLLQDIATDQANASRVYWLVGGGIAAVVLTVFIATRK